jgi:D-alanyl-lipoteichoic acid acyltransferase DltB (MBOAT superfamily)
MQFLRNSLLAIDFSLLVSVLVCIAASALVSLLPILRSTYGLLTISLLATAGIYRHGMLGYLLINLLAFIFVAALAWLSRSSPLLRRHRWRWSCAAMLVLLAIFLAGRYYQLETRGVPLLGMKLFFFSLNMWAFLRLITLLWEFGSGRIERPSLFSFVIWIGLPFTLLGPVLRYSQFGQQLPLICQRQKTEKILSTPSGFFQGRRFLLGMGQLSLGLLLAGIQVALVDTGNGLPRWEKLVIAFSLAPWAFYLLWAGYFNFMEVLALFWGLSLPPSFNRPFGRRNLSEFWANWNMSATSVFRDYFFYNRWGLAKANLYINTLIVFLMVGVWHGFNGYWILWGLLHGIGFCGYLWYSANKSRFAIWRHKVRYSPFRLAAQIATYVYVCSCWFLPPTILKLMF